MKVKIGKYVNYWDTKNVENYWYKTRHNKHYWDLEDSEKDNFDLLFDRVIELWQRYVNNFVNRKVKDKIKRKVVVKIDNWDIWSADHTLALIIFPLLQKLQETKQGSPFVDDADVPDHLKSTSAPPKENEWDTDDLHHDRWEWVLGEVVWAFEQLVTDSEEQFYSGVADILFQPLDDEMKPLGEAKPLGAKEETGAKYYTTLRGDKHTLKIDMEGLKAHHKRISNGLVLFGKYYRGLWD